MTLNTSILDEYEDYEEQLESSDRQARRRRKAKIKHEPKKMESEIIAELGETTGLEGGFNTTYKPMRHEYGWLLSSLSSFYGEALISDVQARITGGKEASVYRCEAHPTTKRDWLAAKVYRPRMFRNLRNDKMYREGRTIMMSDLRVMKKTDHRIMRAIGKKTAFGQQVSHTSWLMYEYTTLKRLFELGAAVPEPVSANDNAILMSYHGDARMAAPVLHNVRLDAHEAESLFDEVMRNIELMLEHEIIHGDLSAYNILYWEGKITIIDFPQVSSIRTNPNAHFILQRDIKRICQYFARQGVQRDAAAIMDQLWRLYGEMDR